jgi:acetoacetyl-CoA synthetase
MNHTNLDLPQILWNPSESFIQNSNLQHYINWLSEQKGLSFVSYHQLWEWSVNEVSAFWESLVEYFNIQFHSPYKEVISEDDMPYVKWFEGATLNYAEHIFSQKQAGRPAILFESEAHLMEATSWEQLEDRVARMAAYLRSIGVQKGDRVVAYLPNIPEATIGFLAACSIGAIWSSCSPDFGTESVVDRFAQIEPKVLIAVDGYQYGGKPYEKSEVVIDLIQKLPSLEKVIMVPYLDPEADISIFPRSIDWDEALQTTNDGLTFEAVPFGHPIWVLFSSGTTGKPKAITHSHGGVLLEHLKYLSFHNDVKPGEKFFWFSTTGWMMWNFVQAALLKGATVVLYDGSPGFPNLNVLWKMAENTRLEHFGTSAPYLIACMKRGIQPGSDYDLSRLRSLSSTGAPLPPEAFDWVYQEVKKDLWLCSMSGGTDVCTAFVGGCPTYPVYMGEIQCRALGCALYAFDDEGHEIIDEVGEMVITRPMPSMPIYFWNDQNYERYLSSYFEDYDGIWRHGDWVKVTSRNSLVILGRSDATLNRQGVRIGTAEIYQSVDKISEVKDSLIVNLELSGGRHYMPLFVLMQDGKELSNEVKDKIKQQLRSDYSPRHVPDEIIEVEDIPYTISGKKMETPVKKILMGRPVEKSANEGAMKNPESLDFFVEFRAQIN